MILWIREHSRIGEPSGVSSSDSNDQSRPVTPSSSSSSSVKYRHPHTRRHPRGGCRLRSRRRFSASPYRRRAPLRRAVRLSQTYFPSDDVGKDDFREDSSCVCSVRLFFSPCFETRSSFPLSVFFSSSFYFNRSLQNRPSCQNS